ncbi:hypothetical protein NM688_g4083 [Phlebia brevispora]|uniref:Uncharacterized protein n=1 Tax=Phlebia brevispora TaxID=194682 RepID=A0ACC1T3N0_9APHY|nr:hypothetical protein NM688_g4083 [Phlebia brevispora]
MCSNELDSIENYRAQALAHIRRESLDLYNRLHSIAEDVQFVTSVAEAYPDLPILPNLRCGAWYVDPNIAAKEAAYFKSTDGHFNNWSFNLRRPNLHLLPVVVEHHGFILVDSTRAGKRMPDALSKTVPIWCAVVNRAVKATFSKDASWDIALYTPPGTVSAQEHAQIEARLDGWADHLVNSSYVLPNLECPLRPLWITPATSAYPQLPPARERQFFAVICLSASKQLEEGLERRSNGFSYVQGSGDDHELWGMGLTPEIFWTHKDAILSADRTEIEDLVSELVAQRSIETRSEWSTLPSPIKKANSLLLISRIDDLPSTLPSSLPDSEDAVAYVLISERSQAHFALGDNSRDPENRSRDVLYTELAEGKKGQMQFLGSVLPQALPFIDAQLSKGVRVCVCCGNGKDASVGVALTALQMYFDDDGEFVPPGEARNALEGTANKKSLSTRLQWIITSRPQANPSRATLKRVNEFLLTPPSLRRRHDANTPPIPIS